ncbi:MAG: histidine kinase dimerization/phospho-acceptor domain-containing protein [Oscillospiraceae bacterium]
MIFISVFTGFFSLRNINNIPYYTNNILSYIDGQNDLLKYINENKFNDIINFSNLIQMFYKTEIIEEKEIIKKEIDYYLDLGYRYFIVEGTEIVYDDGLEPKYEDKFILEENLEVLVSLDLVENNESDSLEDNLIYNNEKTLNIAVAQEYIDNIYSTLQFQITKGKNAFLQILISSLTFLITIILICLLSGKYKKQDKIIYKFYDKIYNDILVLVYLISTVLITSVVYMSVYLNRPSEVLFLIEIFCSLLLALSTFWVFSSVSKKAKNSQLYKYTFIYKTYKKMNSLLSKTVENKEIKVRLALIFIFLAIALVLNFLFNEYLFYFIKRITYYSYSVFLYKLMYLLGQYFIIGVLYLYFINLTKDFINIKNGVKEIKNGNLAYNIDSCSTKELKELAMDINNIAEGLAEAVKTAVVSEKIKAELITNVSHDLKTPLTSIISYINLLSEDETLSIESKNYLTVLRVKSDRLKNIIEDLFYLSKSVSGNIDINIEKIDLKKLCQQTLFEMEDKIEESNKFIKTNFTNLNTFVLADGKKIYRVLQNVIDNALKYSLDDTRIFLNLSVEDNAVKLHISNTSSYEMNFSEEQILERFTRGDESRSTEGSGLGLSIAKTFTEVCGGKFNLLIDGDMFKVKIEFDEEGEQNEVFKQVK